MKEIKTVKFGARIKQNAVVIYILQSSNFHQASVSIWAKIHPIQSWTKRLVSRIARSSYIVYAQISRTIDIFRDRVVSGVKIKER
jgi:hypothetical protein